jgi:putative membrane protein insertion efficiency factor
MSCKTILIVVAALLFMVSPQVHAGGHPSSKMEKLAKLNKPVKNTVNYKAYLKKSKNEIEGTAAILFLTYKSFFSSQDQNSCVFTPSCSVYAMESLQHDNPFVAYLKIFDRLQRCHPFVANGEYSFHYQSQRFYDPIH